MKIVEIHPPDYNDSFSSVTLDGIMYLIRFTWSEYAQRWSFGLYTLQKEPIAVGIRIVPRIPLNLHIAIASFPSGAFLVNTSFKEVGRDDFVSGKAAFIYISTNG